MRVGAVQPAALGAVLAVAVVLKLVVMPGDARLLDRGVLVIIHRYTSPPHLVPARASAVTESLDPVCGGVLLCQGFGIRRTVKGGIMIEHTTGGQLSLAQLAAQHHTQPSTILRLTAEHSPGGAFPGNVSQYINGVFTGTIPHDQHMPAGLRLYLPS